MKRLIFVAAWLLATTAASQLSAAVPFASRLTADQVGLLYNPATGGLLLDANSRLITTFQLVSAGGYLTGTRPDIADGSFDVYKPQKFFILKPDGIGDTDFGNVLNAGLALDLLAQDITVTGSFKSPAGPLSAAFIIPEPTTLLPCCATWAWLLSWMRRTQIASNVSQPSK